MSINSFFNETELTIFYRQTHFTFGEFYRSADGTIFAVDHSSNQLFIGDDLLRGNVHGLNAIKSVRVGDDHTVCLTFNDSSTAQIKACGKDAEAILAEVQDRMQHDEEERRKDSEQSLDSEQIEPQAEPVQSLDGDSLPPLSNDDLNEVYSRLLNTGRSGATDYLVSETGMGVKEACKYLDELEKQENFVESVPDPDYYSDGTMTKKAILSTVKKLKSGDRIHLEYKPLIGKLHVYETEYRKLSLVTDSKYYNLGGTADDFDELIDDISDQLYDYLHLVFFCPDNNSEIGCRLKRVTILKKL